MEKGQSIHAVVDQLAEIYDSSIDNLRQAVEAYVEGRALPNAGARQRGAFAYPELRVEYGGKNPRPPSPEPSRG